jgi:hypothetical protein
MTLRKGNKGDQVREIQENLKALGFYLATVDGDFGPKTLRAVLDFQQRYFVDGLVDKVTTTAIEEAVKAWTARDLDIKLTVPNGFAELVQEFGVIEHQEAGGGNVIITNDFAKANIIKVDLPIVGSHFIHRKLQVIFEAALEEVQAKGLDGEIEQFGTWCPRHKMHNPNRSLSTHSWGIACDINWATNQPGTVGDINPGIVRTFERHGFEWGGTWRFRDDMHFQYAKGF